MNRVRLRETTRRVAGTGTKSGRAADGAALVEYVLFLALLVTSILLTVLVLADDVDQGFVATARLLNFEGEPHRHALARDGVYGYPPNGEATLLDGAAGFPDWTARATVAMLGMVAWIATLALAGMLAWRIHRGSRQPAQSGEPVLVPLPQGAQQRLVEKRQQIRRLLSRDFENSTDFKTQVRHLMSKHLRVVSPRLPVAEVRETMNDEHVRHLLVCEEGRSLMGIISDRDLKEREGETAGDIMTSGLFTVPPEMAIGPAISVMIGKRISCLPVVDEDGVCGVLTTTDLMLTLQCILQIVGKAGSGVEHTDSGESREKEMLQCGA